MNERIRLLAKQAEWIFADRATENFSEYDKRLEKFAELIVQECADIIENSRIEGDEGVCLVGATKCKIKQNFGVE